MVGENEKESKRAHTYLRVLNSNYVKYHAEISVGRNIYVYIALKRRYRNLTALFVFTDNIFL